MNNGIFVQGEFLQLKSEPWKKDPTKFNHRLILVDTFQDQDDCPQTNKYMIDVTPEDLPIIQQQAPRLVGKVVIVPVVASARAYGGREPFISYRMPKDTKIMLAAVSEADRKAS